MNTHDPQLIESRSNAPLGGAYVYLRTSFECRAREPETLAESRLAPRAPLGRSE